MGFWPRDRMDQLDLPDNVVLFSTDVRHTFACTSCDLEFESEAELAVHRFLGHFDSRPVIVSHGRELGTSRLVVTRESTPSDWVFLNTEAVELNGITMTTERASQDLAARSSGVVDITANGAGERRLAQIEFALPTERDLEGVDAALQHLINGHELSRRAIIDFIERGRHYPSASRYLDGLASYLFGVLAREGAEEEGPLTASSAETYTARYDTAVTELKRYDRPAAEAICGLVAFHYNHFGLAMRRTRSPFVSAVALRLREILDGQRPSELGPLPADEIGGLDLALADSATERVLRACATAIDGPWQTPDEEVFAAVDSEQPYDQLKLRVIAAEHHLLACDHRAAIMAAEPLRHERASEDWYMNLRERLELIK